MQNINDILKMLDTINADKAVEIYVPSLKRVVKFKSINTGQQKNLIKAAIDNPIFQTRLVYATYEIISENCLEKDVAKTLTYIDGISILMQLRLHSYGANYLATIQEEVYTMNISSILDNSKAVEFPGLETFTDSVYTINVNIPTIFEHYENEKQMRGKKVTNEAETVNAVEVVGDAFIAEISKYIKEITVNTGDSQVVLNYKNLNYEQRYQVLDKLPVILVKSVMGYIEKVVNLQRQLLTFNGTNVQGEVKLAIVSMDSSLFNLNDS